MWVRFLVEVECFFLGEDLRSDISGIKIYHSDYLNTSLNLLFQCSFRDKITKDPNNRAYLKKKTLSQTTSKWVNKIAL